MRIFSVFFICIFTFTASIATAAPAPPQLAEDSKSAILLEQSSGTILFEKNPDERLPIASVTKIMTLLLAMEDLDSGVITLDTMVTCSEHAASMGGSQVYMQVGEQMSVHDIFKAIAVASGNDASVAIAEHLSGSESVFVERMNARAAELGMKNTHFINTNGLDEGTEAYSCARDVSIMSRELLKHPKIHDYLTIWMDSLRGGEFQLSNTNRLLRFYSGANGIKTGSTSEALYCLSASAKREDMQLISVVLGASSTDARFGNSSELLDFGFANFAVINTSGNTAGDSEIAVSKGVVESVALVEIGSGGVVVAKSKKASVTREIELPKSVSAPLSAGQKVGEVRYMLNGEVISTTDLVTKDSVAKLGFFAYIWKMLYKFACFN
ncbi:MAG: D-alanyl-D-alanine carboxypeptidase [Clostridiales bacterium]|jgi:D-alanyl-D-alanine carboxypeptidase (penicillin-binding protein 5/6)|nr:D-alanyl-D-alanine carboxypeptidase [Clostridiales bacterium]